MPLQLRNFQAEDDVLAGSLKEPAKSCLRFLYNRTHAEKLFVVEPTYGTTVWADQKLQVNADGVRLEQPIGVVLEGVLEVTERFQCGPVVRRRTTAILGAGDFFGLFEAFGGLRGFWDVTAGVQRFLVTSRFGNASTLGRRGWKSVSETQLHTLQHRVDADYDYSDLVRFALRDSDPSTAWKCRVVLFDLKEIRDTEARVRLLDATVAQLASLAIQNPPDALFPETLRAKDTAERLRVGATLDAILRDHIPVLSAYNQGKHKDYGPFELIVRNLSVLGGWKADAEGVEENGVVRLWVPDKWSRVTPRGALYLDALAKKFDMKGADKLLKVGREGLALRSGTRIDRVGGPGDDTYTALVTVQGSAPATLHRLVVRRKLDENRLPKGVHESVFPPDTPKSDSYGWPLHLGSGFFLEPHA